MPVTAIFPPVSVAETAPPWCYRHRSRIIVALAAVLVVWPWFRLPLNPPWLAAGCATIVLGVALRLWCIRQIGGAARKRRELKAVTLVTWGPYALSRNPIYLANMAILGGFALLAGLAFIAPALLAVMWAQYVFTVRHEESFLRERFGVEFDEYTRRTARWLPWRPRWRAAPDGFGVSPIAKVLHRERSLVYQVVAGLALVAVLRGLPLLLAATR